MNNPWLRLYTEIINDPKLLVVTEALRWRYVALLSLKCNGQYSDTPDDEIACALRITLDEWKHTKEEFIKRRLLDEDGTIHGWQKRQFVSDLKDPTAAERNKRYRDNKRNERNATVSLRSPEQKQSRAESDSERKKAPSEIVDRSWKPPPASKDFNLNDFACACAVLAELLGKKQLARQDQETVGRWCSTYDMAGEAFPLIGKKFKQYVDKNGTPPKSLKYFDSMLAEGCKNQPPYVEVANELGKKLRAF